jgi:hypothetical protein
MYKETRGLNLRFGNLIVMHQASFSALTEYDGVLHAVATKYHAFIRHIDLLEKSGLRFPSPPSEHYAIY